MVGLQGEWAPALGRGGNRVRMCVPIVRNADSENV